MLSTPTPDSGAVAAKRVAAKRGEDKRGRGRAWVFIEMLCAVFAVTGVNQDLCDGRSEKERLAHMNTAYEFQVESMHEAKKWVDQFGATEDKITPAQSIQELVHEIKSNTEGTPISNINERIMRVIHSRNEAGEDHLGKQLLLLLNCGNVVEAHPGNACNPRLPILFTEPFPKFLVESGKSLGADVKLLREGAEDGA